MQQLSRRGAGACAAHEALYLYAYADPGTGGDPWTAGIGHTAAAGPPPVKRGDRWTMPFAFQVYRRDMGAVVRDVNRRVRVKLTQHQFDALCSFHLNTGAIGSGTVDDKLNRGDVAGALGTVLQYTRAGGKVMPGLVTRRREEVEMFRTGRYPVRKLIVRDRPGGQVRLMDPMTIPWDDVQAPAPVIEIDRPLPPVSVSPVRDAPVASQQPGVIAGIWKFLKGWFS